MRRMAPVRRRTILTAALLTAAVLVLLLPIGCSAKSERGKTNDERVAYLNALGWTVDPVPTREQIIQLPKVFPEVLLRYNELQKEQGFDLTKFAGKTVTMYCYRLVDPESDGETLCTLYVYKNRIIGGDRHSVALDGTMERLR